MDCPHCKGTGILESFWEYGCLQEQLCDKCDSTGKVLEDEELD